MVVVTAEHAHIAATDHMDPMDQQCVHPHHITFKHIPLKLPSFSNIQPVMALQNEIVKSNIWCLSSSSSHTNVRHVSSSQGFTIPSGLGRMMVGAVVVLLLLMSGDIETNPGPVGEYINMENVASFNKKTEEHGTFSHIHIVMINKVKSVSVGGSAQLASKYQSLKATYSLGRSALVGVRFYFYVHS